MAAVDAATLAEAVEAIQRLIQVGALDWSVVLAASRLGGGPGTAVPALQRPTALAMDGAGGNSAWMGILWPLIGD